MYDCIYIRSRPTSLAIIVSQNKSEWPYVAPRTVPQHLLTSSLGVGGGEAGGKGVSARCFHDGGED